MQGYNWFGVMSVKYDVRVIGAGLVGLSTTFYLKLTSSKLEILLLYKEDDVAKLTATLSLSIGKLISKKIIN